MEGRGADPEGPGGAQFSLGGLPHGRGKDRRAEARPGQAFIAGEKLEEPGA